MMRRIWMAGIFGLTLAAAAGAHAQSVVNGGFETGDLTGWTTGGGGNAGVDISFPKDGSYNAFISSDFATGTVPTTLSQIIHGLTPGSEYEVDFFVASLDEDPASTLDASMAGASAPQTTADTIPAGSYLPVSFDIFPTLADETLQFTAADDAGNFYLDDVSITPVNSTAIPEPTPLLILASAVATLATLRRKQA